MSFVSDSFTGTAGTDLSVHNIAWMKNPGFASGSCSIGSDGAVSSGAAQANYYNTVTPPSADYEVSADLSVKTTVASPLNVGVISRSSTLDATYYLARWRDNTITLFRTNAGGNTTGGAYTTSFAAGRIFKLRLRCVGSTIDVLLDGSSTPVISWTDPSPITAAGKPGIWVYSNTLTTGVRLDNFSAADPSIASVSAVGDIASSEAFGTAVASLPGVNTVSGAGGLPSGEVFGTAVATRLVTFSPASDSFAGVAGTELSAYSAAWAKHPQYTAFSAAITSAGRIDSTGASAAVYLHSAIPSQADYEVSVDAVRLAGIDSGNSVGVVARSNDTTATFYMARWQAGMFQLYKLASGTSTQLGTNYSFAYTAGAAFKLRLRCIGSAISVYKDADESPIISVVDTAITASGRTGLWTWANDPARGAQIDAWRLTDPTRAYITAAGAIAENTAFGSPTLAINGAKALSSVGAIASAEAFGVASITPTIPTDVYEIAPSGLWTWFTDPRAVYAGGCTYVGWVNNTHCGISKRDHATAITTSFDLAAIGGNDHNNPSIYIRPDGRLMAFYTMHPDDAGVRYRVSVNPGDISAWATAQVISVMDRPDTYSNPHYLSAAGRVFVHSRTGPTTTAPNSIVSSADFATWIDPTVIIATANQRPYVKSISNGVDRIDFFFTNAHAEAMGNVYHCYAQWDTGTSALKFYTSSGTIIALPVEPGSEATLVYDPPSSSDTTWVWDINYGADGRPRVLWAKIYISGNDHRYMTSRWTGTAWTAAVEVVAAGGTIETSQPYYSPGVCFDANDPTIIYASVGVGSAWEIQRFDSADNGVTWAKTADVTNGSASGVKNCRPYSPRNHGNEAKVIWWSGRYNTFIDYTTSIKALGVAGATNILSIGAVAIASVAAFGVATLSVAIAGPLPPPITTSTSRRLRLREILRGVS